jgi:hypothetical protein
MSLSEIGLTGGIIFASRLKGAPRVRLLLREGDEDSQAA